MIVIVVVVVVVVVIVIIVIVIIIIITILIMTVTHDRYLRRDMKNGFWILCGGGCSGSGVQWIGVVSYSKLVYNVI